MDGMNLKDGVNLLFLKFREISKEKGNDIVLIEEENNNIIITIFQILDRQNVECYTTSLIKSEIFSISLNHKFVKSNNNLLLVDDYPAYELVIKKIFSEEEELKIKISKLIEKIDPKIVNELKYYLNEFKNKQESSKIKSPRESPRIIGPPPGLEVNVPFKVFQFLEL